MIPALSLFAFTPLLLRAVVTPSPIATQSRPVRTAATAAISKALSSQSVDPALLKALTGIATAVELVQAALRVNCEAAAYANSTNNSGDDQLQLDILTDNLSYDALLSCGQFENAISEETPTYKPLTPGAPYTCSFDPLDGSSVIGPNFSVGGIYAIWPAAHSLVGHSGRSVLASAVAVYGSRTTLFVGVRDSPHALEFTLVGAEWVLSAPVVQLAKEAPNKIFAFGNLRASNDSRKYNDLLQFYLSNRYTLRYTGGMVPDVMHILSKKGGVFTNCSSKKAKAKLRFLYEIAAIALLVEVAGGGAVDESGKAMLDNVCDDDDMRVGGCIGSQSEVVNFLKIMGDDEAKTDGQLSDEVEARMKAGESIESIFK